MSSCEFEVERRLCDQVNVSYLGLRWNIRCYAVDRTTNTANRTAILTVLAVAASLTIPDD